MPSLTIDTAGLCELLADVALFVDSEGGPLAGVYLHCDRADLGYDPGSRVDVLTATASDRSYAAHAVNVCDGRFPDVWLSTDQVSALVAVFRPLSKVPKDAPAHKVLVARRVTGDGQGFELTVTEAQVLFSEGGPELTLPLADPDGYPIHSIARLFDANRIRDSLAHPPDYRPLDPMAVRTDLSPKLLAPFAKVAAHRGPLQVYRWHQQLRLLLQAGDRFTGILMPIGDLDGDTGQPDAPLLFPEPGVDEATGELAEALDDLAAQGATVTVHLAGDDDRPAGQMLDVLQDALDERGEPADNDEAQQVDDPEDRSA